MILRKSNIWVYFASRFELSFPIFYLSYNTYYAFYDNK